MDDAKERSRARYREWYERNKDRAREMKRKIMKRLRSDNREKYNQQSRKAKQVIREKLLVKYGRSCAGCGFSDARALTLDHVRNNGAEERRSIGERGVYYRALSGDHDRDYQILCMNCQFIKRIEAGRQNQH